MKKVAEFTIDRGTWARGGRNGPSQLCNDAGARCCLGFYLDACGFSADKLQGKVDPLSLLDRETSITELEEVGADWLVEKLVKGWRHTDDGYLLIGFNDTYFRDEASREQQIQKIFKEHEITVTFEG